jgi:CMP/dCMP kinase
MIVTVDGYAKSGKSAAAMKLADLLGFAYLDTGAMYRAAGLALREQGIDIFAAPRDAVRIAAAVATFHYQQADRVIRLNEVNYTDRIGTDEVGAAASKVGTFPEVRKRLQSEQIRLASGGNTVCDGRDQGTSVFPFAEVKFFVTADATERARRRVNQLAGKNLTADFGRTLADILFRDRQDTTRLIDPLVPAADAFILDTTELTVDEVSAVMFHLVTACRSRG